MVAREGPGSGVAVRVGPFASDPSPVWTPPFGFTGIWDFAPSQSPVAARNALGAMDRDVGELDVLELGGGPLGLVGVLVVGGGVGSGGGSVQAMVNSALALPPYCGMNP
jgi:hypothetical protein